MQPVVLALLAHPDDAEILCAGTLIRLKYEQSYHVHIATLTAGDCGSIEHAPLELSHIRRAEGASAAGLMGAQYHCLEEGDMRVHCTDVTIEKAARLIQKIRPTIIITHSPDDYHPDHEATSKIARSASFAAPIPNYLHSRASHPALGHIPHLYYCDPTEGKDIFGRAITPTTRINVTGQIELKEQMLAAHDSQRNWLLKHHGVDDYLISMRSWTAKQGEALGVAYAEGFRQHLGHSYPQNDILRELLENETEYLVA
jgi:N-acetylglucosamine malate deacetylase 1